MKSMIGLLLLTLGLSACAPQPDSNPGSNSADQTGGPTEQPGKLPGQPVEPKPAILAWGDLACQRSRQCEDPVLNIGKAQWLKFFADLESLDSGVDKDFSVFRCGFRFESFLAEHFGSASVSLSPTNRHVLRFLDQVFDDQHCRAQASVDTRLRNYFINTQEFKNENAF